MTKYVIYNRMEETSEIGDITDVKEEIMDYLIAYMKYYLSDVMTNLESFQLDLDREEVGARDITMIRRQQEMLDKIANSIVVYIKIETANDFEKMLEYASEVLAVEEINELLQDEIELLTNHEKPETAELLKKCKESKKSVWVGFDRSDEYGVIICEVE